MLRHDTSTLCVSCRACVISRSVCPESGRHMHTATNIPERTIYSAQPQFKYAQYHMFHPARSGGWATKSLYNPAKKLYTKLLKIQFRCTATNNSSAWEHPARSDHAGAGKAPKPRTPHRSLTMGAGHSAGTTAPII